MALDDFNTYASNTASTLINIQRTLSNKQDILTAGDNITITNNVISATTNKMFITTENIASPSDTPYNLFSLNGLTFTALATMNAVSLRISSNTPTSLYGYVSMRTSSTITPDNQWSSFVNESLSNTPFNLYTFNTYEVTSTATGSLDITLFYGTKAMKLNILKYGQMYLKIIADPIEA